MALPKPYPRMIVCIQGSAAEDLILSCFFACCTTCQEAREAGARNKPPFTVPFTQVGAPPPAVIVSAIAAPEVQSVNRPADVDSNKIVPPQETVPNQDTATEQVHAAGDNAKEGDKPADSTQV